MQQSLLALKEIEKSTEVSPTIEYSSKIRQFSKLPTQIKVTLPTFITKQIDRDRLCSLFGQITPISTATEEHFSSLNQPNTSVRELLNDPELVATIQTQYEKLSSVTFLNEKSIWASGWDINIKWFNIGGSILKTIKTNLEDRPNDIALDSDGNLLYLDWKTNTVNKGNYKSPKRLMRLQGWIPVNLCISSTSDLIVSVYSVDLTQSKVVRYSVFIKKQTIQFDIEG